MPVSAPGIHVAPAQPRTDNAENLALARSPGLLVVFTGGRAAAIPLPIESGVIEIGRDHPALSSLTDPCLSRHHLLVRYDGRFVVTDLGSRNGTTVDGVPVPPRTPREVTRVIRAGTTLLVPVQNIAPLVNHGVEIVGQRVVGPTQRATRLLVEHAARLERTLHLLGESGTGKEALARAYHAAGPTPAAPFRALRCAGIPAGAVEQVLFGSAPGSDGAARGYVRAADGGTLYLDGVAALPMPVQARLLHLLEQGEVFPLGATRPEKVDLRICFVARRDLRDQVDAGRLSESLYFRLAETRVLVPALRSRLEEVSYLLQMEVARVSGLPIHASLVEACLRQVWPGNVRELLAEASNAAHAAVAAGAAAVDVRHLHAVAGSALDAGRSSPVPSSSTRSTSASQMRERVVTALESCAGNVSAAARELGVHRTQLRRWLDRYDIEPRTFGPGDEK